MNIIILQYVYKCGWRRRAKSEKRTKELEDGKEGRYAMPFCGATVAMEAVLAAWCISGRRRRKKMEVKAV